MMGSQQGTTLFGDLYNKHNLTIPAATNAGIAKTMDGGLMMTHTMQTSRVYIMKVCGPGKLGFGAAVTIGYADDTLSDAQNGVKDCG